MADETLAPETPVAPVTVASESPSPAPQVPPGPPAESASPSPEAPVETGKQPEQEAKRRSAQERIDQLTAKNYTVIAERDLARQEAARLRAEIEQLARQPLDHLPYEEQEAARRRIERKVDRFEEKAAYVETAETRAAMAREEAFNAKVDAVRDRMPDFDQVFHSRLPITATMAELISDSERGPEIGYYLGKNEEEAGKIARLPPHLQGAAIARIEAKVSLAKPRIVSATPAPVPTLGGAAAGSGVREPGQMSPAEFAAFYGPKWRKG